MIRPKSRSPAWEMWRQQNPIHKRARRVQQSMREYLESCGYGKGASLSLEVMPSLSLITKVAQHEGEDEFELLDKCRTWYALRPDHAMVHYARTVWLRNNPLRLRREERGWSRDDLAKVCALHPNTIKHAETNVNTPRIDTVEVVARKLAVSPITLMREMYQWRRQEPNEGNAEVYLERNVHGSRE